MKQGHEGLQPRESWGELCLQWWPLDRYGRCYPKILMDLASDTVLGWRSPRGAGARIDVASMEPVSHGGAADFSATLPRFTP